MSLDPKVKKLLDIKGFDIDPQMDIKTERELSNARAQYIKNNFPLRMEKILLIKDIEIALSNRKIKVRIYKNNKSNHSPLIMYFHGGGFVLGDLDSSDSLCRSLAVNTDSVVISVDYRLSPETPFPGALYDCYDAMLWAITEKNNFGFNSENITVMGTSAGGNLAGAVSILARDKSFHNISHQVLLNPVINCDTTLDSYSKFGDGSYGLSTDRVNYFWNKYIQNEDNKKNYYAAIDLNDNFENIPPITIVIAEYDCLKDEAVNYGNLMNKNGIECDYKIFEGMNHGFNQNLGILDKADEALNYVCKRIEFYNKRKN